MATKLDANPFSDIYKMPPMWHDMGPAKDSARNAAIIAFIAGLIWVVNEFGLLLKAEHQSFVGKPDIFGIYSPFMLFGWIPPLITKYGKYPGPVTWLMIREGAFLFALALIAYAIHQFVFWRLSSVAKGVFDTRGSARVATYKDVETFGLFTGYGPYLGYVIKPPNFFWEKPTERYLRASEEGHTLVVAPTGSGKTTSYGYQLLTTWRGSIFCYDLKGEQWTKTAGYRNKYLNSKCLRLALADNTPGNAHFNPLDTIRIGTDKEYQDVLDLVEVITDPEGKGHDGNTMSEGHFLTLAASLLCATVLYVLYTFPEEKRTLTSVLNLLSDPNQQNTQTILEAMRDADHDRTGKYGWVDDFGRPTRKNKFIVSPAQDIILLTEEARSSMIATCKRYLKPYRNPMVEEATRFSDFNIRDLVDQDKNLSLYLVVPASSKDSLKPVTRLIINQIMKKLVERLPGRNEIEKRLHIILDEFDSLGRLTVFSDGIQFLRGYGMTASIIIQGYNQIYARYGQHEMITSACRNVLVFTPNDDDTAERISKRMGNFTYREKVPANGKGAKDSYTDGARALLYADEVRKIPRNRCLIFPEAGMPIYAYKKPSFEDAEFDFRTSLQPPFDMPENLPQYDPNASPIVENTTNAEILQNVSKQALDDSLAAAA